MEIISQPIQDARTLAVVIPVKDNQMGIEKMLDSFFMTTKREHYPAAIIVVDNLSKIPSFLPEKYKNKELPIEVIQCDILGPGNARNVGVNFALKHYKPDWILFVDSDCIFTADTIEGYLKASNDKETSGAIAYQGSVEPCGIDWLSNHYSDSKALAPDHPIIDENGIERPLYLVTANALVMVEAFTKIGGFDKDFIYSAEDVDLAFRLAEYGDLAYAHQSLIRHDYLEGETIPTGRHIQKFARRYRKYGWGEGMLFKKYGKKYEEYIEEYGEKSLEEIPKKTMRYMRILGFIALYRGYDDFVLKTNAHQEALYV